MGILLSGGVIDGERRGNAVSGGVGHPVRALDGEALPVVEQVSFLHAGRIETDIHGHPGELRRDIVFGVADRHDRIFADLAGDAVIEGILQPLARLRDPDIVFGFQVAVNRSLMDAGMEGAVVPADVFRKKGVELLQGVNL